jgi:hypothetical protein
MSNFYSNKGEQGVGDLVELSLSRKSMRGAPIPSNDLFETYIFRKTLTSGASHAHYPWHMDSRRYKRV